MKNFILFLNDVQNFMEDKTNKTIILLLLLILMQGIGFYRLETKVVKCEKKTDFRYFNLTRSLEDIHNVKIDTYRGRVEK
ncbi:TPA: hypothetical protein CPT96_03290 [Candidatus Gastranaerophilales bacterium HUM_10]|jgi:hypothetical protein|nr:MAG TPA: hypothetical protein CPT96_03290 [Candidatus Gastranaerophilales bacterium HUM_10]